MEDYGNRVDMEGMRREQKKRNVRKWKKKQR